MSIDRSTVEHISRLAYVRLSDAEIDAMAGQLSSVLDHISRLAEVDTEGVEPTNHVVPMHDVMRDDVPRPSWPPTAVLINAPAREGDYFEVQAVLE